MIKYIWNRIEGSRTRWLIETLTGLIWPTYALLNYPLGTLHSYLALVLWVLTGFAMVRFVALVVLVALHVAGSK